MRWGLYLLQIFGLYAAYRGWLLCQLEVTGTGIAVSEFGFLITPPYFVTVGIALIIGGLGLATLPFLRRLVKR
ncbi:hypothetical protein [Brevibacillus massiliensis]|uniref:hypothetical protein n=1 Tax=Brevibacillus massiliensis TaxID=1118054 RepID=UPI0011CAB425|nr:hypothetical protein [Brevibacillus massiliensis]